MLKISKINFNKQKIKDYVRNKYDWDEIVQQFICLINNK